MNESTAPQPTYPRTWMQPFLDSFIKTGHLANSAKAHPVTVCNVYRQASYHPGFAAALAAAKPQ